MSCEGRKIWIEPGAKIANSVTLSPFVYVGGEVEIGEETYIGPNVTLLGRTVIGRRVRIGPGAVIGWEGFGYEKREGGYKRVEHTGIVVIEDDVEIGPLVNIARAKPGRQTRIGRGTKIDALVHIAHNVFIGEGCIITAQCGIAGSAKIGDRVVLLGQVGIKDHIEIGAESVVYAKSAVLRSIPPNSTYFGIPARPARETMRLWARLWQHFGK
ncbi:MAG: UDP-3-O-(3-hydroxymyristoyl)glucosamine N-acyltransferase [candidate division WOR-3 bacterium]